MNKDLEALKELAQQPEYQFIDQTIQRLKKIDLDDKTIEGMLIYAYQRASKEGLNEQRLEKILNALPMIDLDEILNNEKEHATHQVVLSMEEANFLMDMLKNPTKLMTKDIAFTYIYADLVYDQMPAVKIRFMNNISILHLISLLVKRENDDVDLKKCKVRYTSHKNNESTWLSQQHLKTLVSDWLVDFDDTLDIYFSEEELEINLVIKRFSDIRFDMLEYVRNDFN